MIRRAQQGFTLLELMVSLLIFAVLSVMAYGGLRTVLDGRSAIDSANQELARVQRLTSLLSLDLIRLLPIQVIDGEGQALPMLSWDGSRLSFNRVGHANPQGLARGQLLRVSYELRGDRLYRQAQYPLPLRSEAAASETLPVNEPALLLQGVTDFGVRILDPQRQWQKLWPPQLALSLEPLEGEADSLPLAIEWTLSTAELGEIRQLLLILQQPMQQRAGGEE